MFDDLEGSEQLGNDRRDILAELEGNTQQNIRQEGSHFRIQIKAKLTVRPGNTSEKHGSKYDGISAEVTDTTLSGLFMEPLRVGDLYRLLFDRSMLDLPETFARCVRCRLIQEDAYEVGFEFFASISLPENVAG